MLAPHGRLQDRISSNTDGVNDSRTAMTLSTDESVFILQGRRGSIQTRFYKKEVPLDR